MYNVSASGSATGGIPWIPVTPTDQTASSAFRAPGNIVNTTLLPAGHDGAASAGAIARARQATPVECRHRIAMAIRWTLFLSALQRTPAALDVITKLVGSLEAGRMPSPATLASWDRCFENVFRQVPTEHAAGIATARAARAMLEGAPGDVRIASAATQGVWITVGSMVAVLWSTVFAHRSEPLPAAWKSVGQANTILLACNNANHINLCARQLAGLAEHIRGRQAGGDRFPEGLLAYSRALDTVAAMASGKDDAYYDALGGQLTNVGTFDGLLPTQLR